MHSEPINSFPIENIPVYYFSMPVKLRTSFSCVGRIHTIIFIIQTMLLYPPTLPRSSLHFYPHNSTLSASFSLEKGKTKYFHKLFQYISDFNIPINLFYVYINIYVYIYIWHVYLLYSVLYIKYKYIICLQKSRN